MALWKSSSAFAAAAALSFASAAALAGPSSVEMMGADGEKKGTVEVIEAEDGLALRGKISGISPGEHAIHIHETGTCEGDFSSAGGHFNPTDAKHGLLSEEGAHLGDMPNIVMPVSGMAEFSVFAPGLALSDDTASLENALDDNGAAIVIHDGPDDYKTNPAGDAGARVACGVIGKAG